MVGGFSLPGPLPRLDDWKGWALHCSWGMCAVVPPPPAEGPHDGMYKGSDRASDEERERAIRRLEAEGFTDIHLPQNGAYFYQLDKERWGAYPYPKVGQEPSSERTLAGSGCAPTALAIADATLRGTRTTPPEVADFSVSHQRSGKADGYGSNTPGLVKDWAREHELDLEVTQDLDHLRDGLRDGAVAVVNVKPNSVFNKGGHVIVINGYATDKDGREWFFVADPGHKNPKPQEDLVVEGGKGGLHHAAGRVRVSRDALAKDMRSAYVLSNPA